MELADITDDDVELVLKCGGKTVKDVDDNEYNIILLGNQCWMKENMRAKHFADGTDIEYNAAVPCDWPRYYYPNNDASLVNTYGLLYNWYAAVNVSHTASPSGTRVQGVCPTGWHVPSMQEFYPQLSYYLTNLYGENHAKAMASTSGWTNTGTYECPGYNQATTNNASGFTAYPAGYYSGSSTVDMLGQAAFFWSSTQWSDNPTLEAQYIYLHYNVAAVAEKNIHNQKIYGFSVRCIKD